MTMSGKSTPIQVDTTRIYSQMITQNSGTKLPLEASKLHIKIDPAGPDERVLQVLALLNIKEKKEIYISFHFFS